MHMTALYERSHLVVHTKAFLSQVVRTGWSKCGTSKVQNST